MPIDIKPVTSLDLFTVKRNFEKIGRNGWSLQKPTNANFVSAAPSTADLDEGQAVFYVNGATYRIYFKVNGNIRYVALTA